MPSSSTHREPGRSNPQDRPRCRRAPMHRQPCNGATTVVCPCWLYCLAVWCSTTQALFGKEDAHIVEELGEAFFFGLPGLVLLQRAEIEEGGVPSGCVWDRFAAAEASSTKQCLIFSKSYTFCHNIDGTKPQHKSMKSTNNSI